MTPRTKFEEILLFDNGYDSSTVSRWIKHDGRSFNPLHEPWRLTAQQLTRIAEIVDMPPDKIFWAALVDMHRATHSPGGVKLAAKIVKLQGL